MKPAYTLCSIIILLQPAISALGNEVTFPAATPISISGNNSSPRAAYNPIDQTWLVIWLESFGVQGSAARGRIVLADGTFHPDVLPITGVGVVSEPQVAHDPVRNEWMVVWVTRGSAGEPAQTLRARKVAADGNFVGNDRLLTTLVLGAALGGPRVAAAAEYDHPAVPPDPYFLVVWADAVNETEAGALALRLSHDPNDSSGIGIPAPAFRLDTGGELDGVPHSALNPEITSDHPSLRGVGQSSRSNHRVSFTVHRGAVGSIYLASIDLGTVLGVTRVTPESAQGFRSQVEWNRATGRTLVTYFVGDNLMGRLFEDSVSAPFLQPVTDAALIVPASSSTLVSHLVDSTFLLSAYSSPPEGSPPETGLACLTGLALVGNPASGKPNARLFTISPRYDGRILLGYENAQTLAIDVMILPSAPPPGPTFRRADVNGSGIVDISDPVSILGWLFQGTTEPACLDAADVNDSGAVDLSDPVYALNWLFTAGSAPPSPGPFDCGMDATADEMFECAGGEC